MTQTTSENRPTGAPPREVGGHIWRCYKTGIMRAEWRTDGGRWAAGPHPGMGSFWARVDGLHIAGSVVGRAKRFKTLEAAMLAAVKS